MAQAQIAEAPAEFPRRARFVDRNNVATDLSKLKAPTPVDTDAYHLSLDTLVPYLLQSHLLSPEDAVAGVRIEDKCRRNRNFKVVTHRGDGVLVKQPEFSEEDQRMVPFVAAEATILRRLTYDDALRPIRPHAPVLVYYDQRNVILATQLVHPATSITKYHLNRGNIHFHEHAAVSCARLLATFHTVGTRAIDKGRLDFLPNTLPIAHTFHELVETQAKQGDRLAAIYLKRVKEEAPALKGASVVEEAWRSSSQIVHGDARWDNLLLTHGLAADNQLNLRLIDWELVSKGDSAYDVACWFGEYVRFWWTVGQNRGIREAGEYVTRPPFPLASCHESAHTFWETYCQRRGYSKEQRRATFERVLKHFPRYLLLAGWEFTKGYNFAGMDAALPACTETAIQMARDAHRDPRSRAREWFGLEE